MFFCIGNKFKFMFIVYVFIFAFGFSSLIRFEKIKINFV